MASWVHRSASWLLRAHWQHACRLFLQEANVAAVTRQVHLAIFMDGNGRWGVRAHETLGGGDGIPP